MIDESYFCHSSTGWVHFDPGKGTKHFDAWWALLICDEEILKYYAWFALKRGVVIQTGSRWRSHISFIKGQKPSRMPFWGRRERQKVEFRYSNIIRWDNGKHAWLDVYSPGLNEIRKELGIPPKDTYHLTIGRLETERTPVDHKYDHRVVSRSSKGWCRPTSSQRKR